MALRGIGFARVSMQRAGVLLAITSAAHETRGTDLAGLTSDYSELLWRKVKLLDERDVEQVQAYIDDQRLRERYPKFYGHPGVLRAGEAIQAQDIWLSDPALPSSTGAITQQAAHEPPQLAVELQLLRRENYTRTDRGNALLALSQAKIAALRGEGHEANPLALSLGQQLFLLAAFLEADFDLVQEIYRGLLESGTKSFQRSDVSELLPEACGRLLAKWRPQARLGRNQQRLLRMQDLKVEIEKSQRDRKERRQRPGATWGGARPPESTGTVRVEPYVDLGLVTKPQRARYGYTFTPTQRQFFEGLAAAEEPEAYLNNELVTAFIHARGEQAVRASDDVIWERVTDAYLTLRSRLGYAAFREVVILAVARLIEDQLGVYFEVADGIRVIRSQKERDPRSIKFGVARGGGLTYMKLAQPSRT